MALVLCLSGGVLHPVVPAQAQDAVNPAPGVGQPFVYPLFSDHMVLQRDRKVSIWGWSTPGDTIEVSIGRKKTRSRAGNDGKWSAQIGPYPAGGPYTLQVASRRKKGVPPQQAQFEDVQFGDVWLCSGQSNMQWRIGWGVNNKDAEIAAANLPQIRFFTVPNTAKLTPSSAINGNWRVVSPKTVADLTAVGYFFGRELNQKLGVPIGLVDSSWGGTVAEAWVSEGSLRKVTSFRAPLDSVKQMAADLQDKMPMSLGDRTVRWYAANDPGSAPAAPWSAVDLGTTDWKNMALPAAWESAGLPDFDGVVWFRKEITIPDSWAGKDLSLSLGSIDDRDTTFWNGSLIGDTDAWNKARDYIVPGRLVRAGQNVIAVRVLDTGGGGGFRGRPDQMKVSFSTKQVVPLAGDWLYRVGAELDKLPPVPAAFENNPNLPTVLYNGMISPLIPYGLKGVIWYQGESNVGRGKQYQSLLPVLITDWRQQWHQGDFPFYIVQLANYLEPSKQPVNDAWAELREAQSIASNRVHSSGLAVTIDIGEAGDIHPKNKQDVGKRLALLALAKDYGQTVEYSGPVYKSSKREGNAIRIAFDHADGLNAKGGNVTGFAIAGADNQFVWADAQIDGTTVIVSSPQVPEPVAVRYAWDRNPAASLFNGAGLPAVPFRTDKG